MKKKITFKCFILFCLVSFYWSPILKEAAAAIDFGPNLIGQWRFDEGSGTTAFDSSGMGNNAFLTGGVSFTNDLVRGGVVAFTSTDGIISVPSNPSLNPSTGAVAAWVNIAQPGNYDIITKITSKLVRTNISGGHSVYGLRIINDGSIVGFVGNDDPTTPGFPWRSASSSAGLITPGVWNEIAFRWNGATVDIFVNSILQASTPYDPVPGLGLSYNGASDLGFGAPTAWGVPSDRFLGKMDDIRFWNVQPVPEPSTLFLFGFGLAGLIGFRNKVKTS